MKKVLYYLLPSVKRYTDGKKIKYTTGKMFVSVDKEHPGWNPSKIKANWRFAIGLNKDQVSHWNHWQKDKVGKIKNLFFFSLFCYTVSDN